MVLLHTETFLLRTIYNVISDKVYSESNPESFKLTNSDLVSIYAGTYKGSVDVDAVKSYLSKNSISTGTVASGSVISKFSLNPNNSPYFEVSGYKYNGVSFGTINNGSKITVSVFSGRDQIELNPDSMRLVLKKCEADGSNPGDEVVLVESQENIDKMTDAAEKTAAQKVRDDALTFDESVKIVCSIGKLIPKSNYVVLVEGCDIDGNEVDNGSDVYGFFVQSTGKPPVVDITSGVEDLSVAKETGFSFAGSLYSYAESVSLKYKVTAKNEKDGSETEISSGDLETIDLAEDSSPSSEDYTKYDWTLSVPADKINVPASSLYLYTITFYALDSNGNDTTVLRRIHLDTKAPKVDSMNVTPYYSVTNNVYKVNGKISVSAVVSDNYGIEKTDYTLKLLDETDVEKWSDASDADGFSIEIKDIDTRAVDKGKLVVTIKPIDSAGNENPVTYTIEVDQETDKPVVSFTNLDKNIVAKEDVEENVNLFAQTGSNKILGTVTDDDRIDSIVFEYQPLNSSSWTEFYRKDFASSDNFVSFNLSAILQKGVNDTASLDEGFYNIRYTVVDKDGGAESVRTENSGICIAVDNGAPVFTVTTASGALVGKNTQKSVTGAASDGNGVAKIYRYAIDNSRNSGKTTEYGSSGTPHVIATYDPAEKAITEWRDTFETTDNGDDFMYVAEDVFKRKTQVKFSYIIDSVNPLIDVTSPANQNTIYIGTPYISAFRGTAEDPRYVKKSDGTSIKLEEYNNLDASAKETYKLVDASDISLIGYEIKNSSGNRIAPGEATGTVSWSSNIDFSDGNGNAYEDAASIEFFAEDGAGLKSAVKSFPVVIDTAAPVIEITSVKDSNGNALLLHNNEYYTQGGFVIEGTVTEENLEDITCASASIIKGSYDSTTFKTSFTCTVNSSALAEGRKTFGFTARDKAGQVSDTFNVMIVKDSLAPNLVISNVTPVVERTESSVVTKYVNGKIQVNGTASDANVLKSVELYTSEKASDAGDVPETTCSSATYYRIAEFTGSDGYSWKQTIDTTKYADNTTVTLLAVAYDEAGNKKEITYSLNVNQSTDIPVFTFSNMKENGTTAENLFGLGGSKVYGIASDDDGVAKIEYSIDGGNYTAIYEKGASETALTTKNIEIELGTLSSGDHDVKIKVSDINETPVVYESSAVAFGYDSENPTILVSTVDDVQYTSGMYAKQSFTIVGTASDDSEISGVYLSTDTGRATNLFDSATGKWTAAVTGQTDTAAGETRTLSYIAVDKYGREANTNVTYQVDVTAPVFKVYEDKGDHRDGENHIIINGGNKYFTDTSKNDSSYFIGATDSSGKLINWFNQTQLTVTGVLEEAHLKSVTLTKNGETQGSVQINKNFAFSEVFENGANTFQLKAADEAGNETALPSSGFYTLYVDTNSPSANAVAKKSDGTTDFENGTILSSTGVIILNITAQDSPVGTEQTSGISKVFIGTSVTVDENSNLAEISAADAAAPYTFTVGNSLPDGTYHLYVRAVDVAGNYSTAEDVANFVVDKTAPVVAISSPVSEKTVDKKISISGTVQDANLDSSALPKLWIKEKVSGSWAEASSDSVSAATYSAGSWSVKFDTEKYTDEKEYYIAVEFTDKAGNTNDHANSTHTIKISQDNDRPTIIFSNVELESAMTSSSRKMIKNNQITGTVTDSDGPVAAVYVQVLDKGAALSDTSSAWGTSIYDVNSSMWSYAFAEDGSQDGEKDIYFKVVDAESTGFVSAVAANYLTAPKLQYKTVKFETSSQDTILYGSVDMINPVVKRFGFTTKDSQTTGDYAYTLSSIDDTAFDKLIAAAGTENADLEGWSDISLASIFGGTNKTLYLFVCGYDTTSVSSLTMKVGSSVLTAIKTKKDSTGKYIYGLYKADFSASLYAGKYQNVDISVAVEDTATRTISSKKTVSVDNKAPVVEIKSPRDDGIYFYGTSSNTIMGASSDDSVVKSIYLGFSQNSTTAPVSYTDILAPRAGHEAQGSTVSADSWIISFDGNIASVQDYSHMELFNEIIKQIWFDGAEIGTAVTEKPVYIWAYAEDSIGNTGTPVFARKLNVYTQGDIPSLDVSYPDADSKVGGTVRITGSANIADTSVSVGDVLVQIDLSYETSFNENWESELTDFINNSGSQDEKEKLEAAYPISGVTLGDGTIIRGVTATGTNSWNLTINKFKELNLKDEVTGSDKNRPMAIRVYAINNSETYKKAGNPVIVPFTLDPGSPVFGNKDPLKLVQYNDNDNRSGGIKAVRIYTDNMWISGKWWLEGSIEDDSGIKQVTVSKNGGAATDIDSAYIEDTSEPETEGYKNKFLKMPVGTDEADKFGTEIYEIVAYEGAVEDKSTPITISLNYDNKAPVFDCTTLKKNESNSIVQSNGTYEMKGSLREDSSASANQSGFERIAFSITKTSGGKTYIIDPMISQGSGGSANVYETGSTYSDSVKVVKDDGDGLYWRKESNCTTSGKEISLSGVSAPLNVRSGGLCKLDGTVYRIKSVSGSKIYVEKDLPTYTSSSKTDIYFAVAQVIDNTVKEVGETTTFDDENNSIDNDDGDKMIDYYLDSKAEWVCSINSKNIKDGSVKIEFVAFDQAGNITKASYDGLVSNNRPRIAGITFATDRNGNGTIDTDEIIEDYSGFFCINGKHAVSGVTVNGQQPNGQKVYTLAIPNDGSKFDVLSGNPVMTLKGLSRFVPEIVGGNNGLGYTYAVKNPSDDSYGTESDYAQLNTNHGGDDSVRNKSDTTIVLTPSQLMSKISADGEKDLKLTIWDSTDGTTPGTDSNKAEILLRLNAALYDGKEPVVKLTPFYWNDSGNGNNSVYYKGDVIKGHIELENDLPSEFTSGGTGLSDRDPKVSGIIYLEGQAKDNVMIKELSLEFPTLAESASPTFGKGLVKFAQRTAGVISKVSGLSLDAQGVEVVEIKDEYDSSEYNVVKFKLAIDTEKILSVAKTDIVVKVQAKDRGAADEDVSTVKSSALTKNDETGNSPLYQMDVVPYITKLYTSISETAGEEFARSATGKYIVRGHYRTYSSEYKMWTNDMSETVKIYGFNLAKSVTVSGTTKNSTVSLGTLGNAGSDSDGSYLNLNIGKNTTSGDLSITVNGVESLNNRNANPSFVSDTDDTVSAVPYNCQANGITNNRLDDDVSLYVWDLHGFGNFYDNNITSPMMKMDKAGNYYMSYGYGVPYMYVRKNNTAHSVDGSFNKFHNTNVIFDDNGNLYAVATNTDRVYDQSSRFVFYTPYSRNQNNQLPAEITNTGYEYSTERDSKRHLELAYNRTTGVYDINRVKMPKLASYTKNSRTYIGMSYFDGNNTINPVKARFGYRDGDTISGGISGSIESYTNEIKGTVVTTQSNNPTKTDSSYKNYHIIASDNTTFKGGAYTAVGIVPAAKAGTINNVGVVAWYDASVRKVCYSWNDNLDSPVVGGAWQTNAKYLDGKYTGWYVDLAVDDEGGIHIAYYNSAKGDLKYVYLSKYNATPTEAVTVDSYLSVGTNITVNTRLENGNYVPYIYYYNASANQTPNSIKVAWRNDMSTLRDGAISDKFTGAWECMTIPAENIPVDASVCGGVPTSGTYSNTVVLGYMSDQYYEKAYIKK